jgi:hypothetical protein
MERAAAYAGTLQEHNVESMVPLNNNRGLIVTLFFFFLSVWTLVGCAPLHIAR